MRYYDIQIVDEHICRTNMSQKVLDSWMCIKKDAAEALKPSHNNARDKIFRPCGCVACKHNAMHECKLPECHFSKRKTSPVA